MRALDISSPRTIGQILDTALRLYARMPLLFLVLAAIVLIPYEIVTVLVTQGNHVASAATFLLALADIALVNPSIAALQMQLLLDLGEGRAPALRSVVQRGVQVLPVVAAAEIVASLGELAGLLFFLIPGLILAVRWAVAAPVAAAERTNWPTAIRRSVLLTRGNFWRVVGLLAIQVVLTYLVAAIIGARSTTVAEIVGMALAILAQSFCTLLINLLYFDLRAREGAAVA